MKLTDQYLSLLKNALLNSLYPENEVKILLSLLIGQSGLTPDLCQSLENIEQTEAFKQVLGSKAVGGFVPLLRIQTDTASGNQIAEEIAELRALAFNSHTMIGRARIDNIHECMDVIRKEKIPGDFIETGVWRGGATIFMAGYLAAHRLKGRKVWVADSFEGLPPSTHEKESESFHGPEWSYLNVSLERVQRNFELYGLNQKNVKYLKGWFKDTLPSAPIKRLAMLRLDGDLYESTMDALTALYDKVSPGGFIIVDDYKSVEACEVAVKDFRKSWKIKDRMHKIDSASVYWRKS